jgi:surface protein
MNGHAAFIQTVRRCAVILSLCTAGPSVLGLEVNVTRTNWVERWITNLIEVHMPLNRFVNEYQTNWVTQFHTNVIEVYTTNRVTRTLTNHFLVDALQTNFVTAYQTNWKTLDLTNWQTAVVMKTNWLARRLTNEILVEAFQTNLVTAYQTNLKTLDLTNWQTAIVMTTNWVTQVITNVVQVDLPNSSIAPAAAPPVEAAEQKEVPTEAAPSSPAAITTGAVVLEAARTSRPPNNGQVEVQLKIRANGDPASLPQVQQWRVEREDRAILCFGQDQEFKRELPAGRYKVEVKLRQDGDGALLTVRGTLVVTPGEAVIRQNLTAKK